MLFNRLAFWKGVATGSFEPVRPFTPAGLSPGRLNDGLHSA
jgi:hypothetical protein